MFDAIFGAIPDAASLGARRVDMLFIGLLVFSLALTAIMTFLIVRYLVIYRKGNTASRAGRRRRSLALDASWIGGSIVVGLVLFGWSANLYVERETPPEGALRITAIGKQWMWKMQHPGGQREINTLHVPVGRPVVVELASQDVIHSFYVPAFRMKQDAVPGRATRLWFQATETGTFHLFCAEYCGADHADMQGHIIVMEPEDYAEWLASADEGETLAHRGQRLFTALGCSGCHGPAAAVRAPELAGLFGRPVGLASGAVVIADRRYIWDSIRRPHSQIVAGFEPIMPSYAGLIEPTELMALVAYIESLSAEGGE